MRHNHPLASIAFGLAALCTLSASALAAAPQQQDQAPGFFRLRVGQLEVTSLYDGAGAFERQWLIGTPEQMQSIDEHVSGDPHYLDGNGAAFLVNTGEKLILVDTGAGTWFGGGAFGHVQQSLREAGYSPDQVDIVLITHAHADHIGGLTTPNGARAFPNADVYVSRADSEFWLSRRNEAAAPAGAREFFRTARAVAEPYVAARRWHTFDADDQIVPGLRIVPTPGHTPGHTAYEFTSEGQTILFIGDLMHSVNGQLWSPDIAVVFDVDQRAAVAQRARTLESLSGRNVIVAGPHFSFPSLARLHRVNDSYQLSPVSYSNRWENR